MKGKEYFFLFVAKPVPMLHQDQPHHVILQDFVSCLPIAGPPFYKIFHKIFSHGNLVGNLPTNC